MLPALIKQNNDKQNKKINESQFVMTDCYSFYFFNLGEGSHP